VQLRSWNEVAQRNFIPGMKFRSHGDPYKEICMKFGLELASRQGGR
jgi:hypothetical protein